jgi:hypothetical protein
MHTHGKAKTFGCASKEALQSPPWQHLSRRPNR